MADIIDVERVFVGVCPKCEGVSFILYFPDEEVTIENIIEIECANPECKERLLIDN